MQCGCIVIFGFVWGLHFPFRRIIYNFVVTNDYRYATFRL